MVAASKPILSASSQGGFPVSQNSKDPYKYQVGFGNHFASEVLPGTLPHGQNSPQKCRYDLYAEQVTGTAFTVPRAENQHAWLYRIQPPAAHQGFAEIDSNPDVESSFLPSNPNVHVGLAQQIWNPFEIPSSGKVDFVDGLKTIGGNGDPMFRQGLAVHIYLANSSMKSKAFMNNDGDLLVIPQQGRLDIQTEFGHMMVQPGELCVIQRGIRFKVKLPDGPSRGYIHEIFGSHFELPQLGPLGGTGLAAKRDFEHPVASFDIDKSPWEIIYKSQGTFFLSKQPHTPFDVVAWHGNYVPYKYDITRFTSIGTTSKDHLDPSIFSLLTAKSTHSGVPLTDILVATARWDVATGTFRPPPYHRNNAVEFMGLIRDDKETQSMPFAPGGCMYQDVFCPHGPPYDVFKRGTEADLQPEYHDNGTIVFMFETAFQWRLTDYATKRTGKLQESKYGVWEGHFLQNLDAFNQDLEKAGLPKLSEKID